MGQNHKVTVTYVGLIRSLAKVGEEKVHVPAGASVRDLLHLLAETRGEELRDALFESQEQCSRYLRVLSGSTDIGELEGVDTLLDDVREVTLVLIIPQFAGG